MGDEKQKDRSIIGKWYDEGENWEIEDKGEVMGCEGSGLKSKEVCTSAWANSLIIKVEENNSNWLVIGRKALMNDVSYHWYMNVKSTNMYHGIIDLI